MPRTRPRAIRGGVDRLSIASDTSGFDGLSAVPVPPAIHNDYAYARLVVNKVFNLAKGEKFDTSVDPYAAESWEVSGDGLQVTFRLRSDGG